MFDRKLLLVTGKGGVGRSAVSAALAQTAVRAGLRVLALGMMDDVGIAYHLGSQQLTYEARELRPGLHGLRVDLASALDEYLGLQLHVPRVTRFGPLRRSFEVLAATTPGVREIIAIGKPVFEVSSGNWDLVIADSPPTGQIASYLAAPNAVGSLVPEGRVRDQARWISEVLLREAGLVMVAVPEELPVRESLEALHQIREQNLIDVVSVAANRVLEPLGIPGETRDQLPDGPHRDAAELHASLYETQQRWLAELEPDRTLPYLFGLLTPAEVAARLSDAWEET